MVNLPAEFADEVQAQQLDRCQADVGSHAGQPAEVLVVEVDVADPAKKLARLRPRHHQYAHARRQIVEAHPAVGRPLSRQVVVVEALERARRDEVEAVFGFPVDGEFGVHAATTVERMAQRDTARPTRQPVGDKAVEERSRSRSTDARLRERRHVQETDVVADVAAFGADVFEPSRSPERPVIFPGNTGRCEPVRSLPAELLAEHAPQRAHPLVARCHAMRACRRPLLVRVVDGEDVGVGLFVLGLEVGGRRIVAEPARLDAEHVDCRLAFDDPLRELPARATCGGDAEAVALVEPEVPLPPGRTDDRTAVRRVRDRAVVDVLDTEFPERRDTTDRGFDVRRQAVEVGIEQLVLAVRRRPVQVARRGAPLVRSEQQAAGFLAHVPRAVGFAQDAHLRQALGVARLDLGMRFGDDVLVLHGQDRDVETNHGTGSAREATRGRHHVFADDVALVRAYQPLAAGPFLDGRDSRLAMDRRPRGTRTTGQRLREVGGLDIAVPGVADGADQAVADGQWPDLAYLLRR